MAKGISVPDQGVEAALRREERQRAGSSTYGLFLVSGALGSGRVRSRSSWTPLAEGFSEDEVKATATDDDLTLHAGTYRRCCNGQQEGRTTQPPPRQETDEEKGQGGQRQGRQQELKIITGATGMGQGRGSEGKGAGTGQKGKRGERWRGPGQG